VLARLTARKPGTKSHVQALVLTPTHELAIQVAEAFSKYAMNMGSVRVMPIYGGQEYGRQIRQLKHGVDIVVGTPGRIMDHMRRGTLDLSSLETLVLDEADEMLRMGFIDDVQWILDQTPKTRRMALFSATMPREVKRIASKHMSKPTEVSIAKSKTTTDSIRQRYWSVSGHHKLDTLTRILEAEVFDGMIVFVRTKNATVEVAERLEARGFRAAAMNGDMAQKQREQTVDRLKTNRLDILVATDVVARGLDVDRISHVINYDVPYDAEAYVHRIGRTGRAGRHGDAILFITPREQRMLRVLEKATGRTIEKLALPTTKMINDRRIVEFKQRILDTLGKGELAHLQQLIEEMVLEHNVPATRVAAALAKQMLGDTPLLLEESQKSTRGAREERGGRSSREKDNRSGKDTRSGKFDESSKKFTQSKQRNHENKPPRREREHQSTAAAAGIEMERFRIDVGSSHGVQASNIVGAIANEAGLDSQFIGRIKIMDEHSTVELPTGMPKATLKDLRKVWVCSRKLNMVREGEESVLTDSSAKKSKSFDKPKSFEKKSHKKKAHKKNKRKPRGKTNSNVKPSGAESRKQTKRKDRNTEAA